MSSLIMHRMIGTVHMACCSVSKTCMFACMKGVRLIATSVSTVNNVMPVDLTATLDKTALER